VALENTAKTMESDDDMSVPCKVINFLIVREGGQKGKTRKGNDSEKTFSS
jgi:hypothetical protein